MAKKLKILIAVFLLLTIFTAVSAADTYPHVVSLPGGGILAVECNGGDTLPEVRDGVGKTVLLVCPVK
jgi:hypothetical protein